MLVGEQAIQPSISDAANVKQSTTSLFQHQSITTFDSSLHWNNAAPFVQLLLIAL